MKTCSKCKTEKDHSAFGKDKSKRGGLCWHCKECRHAYGRANRERIAARSLEWAKANPERKRATDRAGYMANREVKTAYMRKYSQANPNKIKAKGAVLTATRNGTLTRPEGCWGCGSTRSVDAHHASYAEDMRLAVTWLCKSCHQQVHADTVQLLANSEVS